MGISGANRINGFSRFSLRLQDSQTSIFPSLSSSTELSLPEKIELNFVRENAFNPPLPKSSCLEMVSFVTLSYTSLKDLLPPSPAGISSSSWDENHEIPIKNRLVQKAASFYLQPMSSSREPDNLGFFGWLGVSCSIRCRSNSECVHGCGCLGFLRQMIHQTFRRLFGGDRNRRNVEFNIPFREGQPNATTGDG